MSNKITYTIKTADGKEHQVSKENIDKYGIQSYASAYRGATIRMRDSQKGDYDIPLQHFDQARKQGLHAFSIEHTPIQKQAAPKPTVPTPTQTISPRLSTPQGRKPLLSDSFGKASYNLKPQPVGYNLSEEHRKEVLGEQAKRSTNPTNPHVQRAVQLGNEAKAKRVGREQKRFGKPTIVRAFDDAVHGDKKAAKELGMPQVMQQKKDEIDYMQATGKELRNPVDAGLTYDENGDIVHSMFAPTVARDEHGNIVTNDAGEPLVGVSSDEARAKAYGDSVQTGIEAQREKDKVDNLYKDAVESVNDAFDEDYKKKEAFRKEHPFLGAVSDALEGFSNRGNALQYVPEGAKPGLSALSMMTKAAQMKENADRYGDAGTLSRLYGGIMAGLTDVNTYDFGITDTFNAANLYRAAKNYEEGKATAKDKMLLDAAAIANNVQSEASDKLGGAFGAGQNLVGTIGFMAQMATNPASGVGKEAAASVAKTIAKRALQKFGNGAIAKAITGLAKGATRVGMDAVEAGVVTGMYSPTKIVGDYLNRKTGDVQSDGKGGYIFQNKEYSDVKALAKAINGQYAENISEMWGEYLPGMGKVNAAIGRGARKIGLGKVVDAFEHMSSSNWAKTWKNFQERTKWNGMAGEYFEEVANNLYNAVTNGDMTLDTDPHTGVFNPKINLDTFYSVALMSGIMSGVNTAGYARERYKAPHEQHKADAQARSVFGERWDEYKNAIDNADEKQIGSVMEKIGSDKSLSNSQKIAALQYQYRTAVVHGVNAQDTKNKLEGQFNAMDEAYSMGYNLQDEKELNNTAILYDEAKKQATKATGWGEDTLESMIGEDGGASTLAYMKHSDEFNDGQLQAFTDYANARAAYNGMIQRVKDDIDTKVHESNLEAEQRTNLDTGAIHPATMKVDDRQVYIVNGNVVMLPDGSGVDHEHSDDFVVLRDAETGELETADPSAIFKVDAPINVQEEKEAAADNIRQTFAQQQADKIDGKLEFKQGDIYSIIDKEDGTQHSLSIIGDAIDEKIGQVNPEMVLVDIDGAQQPILLPKEQVQQQVDEARRAAVAATQVVENVPTNNTNNTYNINDEVTLSDENGNTVRGSITAPQNEDGKFEVYTEQPINGKKVNLFSAEELDSMTKAPTDVAEKTITQQPQQQEDTENSVEKEAPQQQTTAFERIPKDESGQPLYEQTDPETAWDAIVEQTEGDTSMAQTVADDMVSDLEAGVKKAEKTKTKSGGSIAEKIAAEKKRAEVIEQAKATLAHWKKIAAVNRMREAAIQAEEQRKADEVARVRKEQEETARAEQEEAERIKREALNGVPDFVEDKATDARARGYRRVNGDKVDRQEPINATKGKEVQVKFDDDNIPTGHVAIIEANQLQPSHKNGQRNPQHFIDEAQPKERKDDASVGAARKIAANIRPEEITSSVTAYTGAPTVNSRGEVIQGNNRSAALREMWDNHQEQGDKYKKYLIDNAESFGLRAEDIAAMDKPVLVNMLDANDDEAISLGQFVASDTESGGTERIKPKNVVKKLGDKMKNFANILLRANDENISFAELVDSNGVDALKWLNANGVISPTQYKSAFDSKGNITAEAKNDIKGIMYQSIFEGGNTQLEEMFNALPAKAQKAILATAYRDYDSPQSERMIGDIQDSIMAYYALSHDSMFMNAKNHKDARIAVEAWRRQLAFDDVTGESYLPAEKYSNFALLLATMYKGDNQSLIQGTFNKMYDLIQGTQEETLFEQPDNTPRSLAQAIKETLNIEYNGQQGSNVLAGDNSASQEGRTGSNGDTTPRGRSENIDGAEANQGGTERDSGRSGEKRVETSDEGAYSLSQQKADNGENFYQDINGNIDLANIPDEVFNKINKPQAPFRLTPSMLKHVFDRHGKEMGLSKADDAIDFVLDVIDNFDHVRQGEKGAIIFSIENGRSRTGRRAVTVLLDSLSGSYYGIKTSGYERIEGLAKRTLLWEKGAKDTSTTGVAPANVSTEQASQSNEQAGSASNHNNDFEGKDKQSSDTKQENVDNYLEKPARGEDLFAMAERVAAEDKAKRTRKKEEAKVDTNPTEAQKEAGNYKKGHIKIDGFNVTIEQPKGSVRRGKDANGKEWETEMHNTYGYIRGTESVDGDHIDIFLSDNPTEGNVFVVDQVNKDGSFDEHKVMYGFSDMESARKAYLSNYEEGWQGLGNITEVSKEEFKKWIDSSKRKTKPFAEYSTVKTQGDVQTKKPTETEDFARQDLKELEDFQKNTDTTGRTTIDVDRYEAEDLFAPLLLDGKTSRLGVLTVVPDKITDPSGQIAVYDYSDEIDEKTNSGWQKWGDLTDEYNKTVDSSDKAQERGDTATLGFTSVDAALKFYDWLNTGGPKSANKVLEQSNEPMNADGHEYQENGSLQYSTEDLTNNTTAKRLATDTILSALNKAGIEVVRATDEQVQELLANTHATSLRTPQGTIYGWAVDGKIYLTEAGINPDTPIHEYTHLWAEAMMSKNKQGWNNIKTLLKGTSVWEEVVSDSNYSNITNNEDAVASEVLSRISGRENAARMESEAQKVIDEDKDVFEKAKSVTLLNRIKRALDMFWKWVGKELFKIKKFGSINEVTDRVLYDLMHSTKLNSNDKSLIGVHNISEQKLRKVLKQGGFANPSIAVIDTDKQVHNDYGEISLILPSRKINKSTGKNAGTFEGDAWTPMYPVVEKQISSDGRITIHNDINAVPKDMQSEVRNALNRWLENGSDTDLSYLYLFQQGKAPQMIVEKPKYSNEVHKTLNDIMFGVNSVYNLSKNEIKKLVELYIQTELDGNIKEYNEAIQRKISKYEELIKRGKPNSLRYRVADSYLEDIEKYGYPLSPLINFVNDVQRDKIKQGSKNAQKTLNTASQIIKDAGLEKDFKNWIEGLNNRYQTKEVIFDGFTPTGKRRYIPNTLENVSKIMKKQGRQASAGISISFSNFAAAVMKANGSLDNIRKKKSKLTNEHKDIEDFEEKWKEVYFDLAMKLQPNANMFDDYGFARLQEAANEKNPQTYIRNVYGITLSEEDVQKLQDLVEAIREERPALYFETKFERPVILNEFSKAVVPEDLSDDLKKTLRDNGVEVFTYKRGDIEERQKATQEAAYSSNDIAFQVIDNSRDSELIAINEQFNRELAELTEENAQSKRLKLGYPSPMLSAAGVPDKPIILYSNKLLKKAKLHNFDVKELHNLPLAMQNPIAVFEGSHPNSFATLLEIKLGGHNTLASIEVNKKGEADFNFISSLFGKESKGVTKWILDGKLLSVDKEKAQSYISASALNADATYKNELSSAAKIVKDFVNPVIQDENLLRDDTDTLSDIEYEDGNFSELTAEEPLFNVSSSIRSLIEGNLFSEVDFSDSPNKNVNQAISKLTDDKLLKEIAKGDSKEWNFYMEEYDRRHNKEFQEAVERYMNSLEDEKTSLDTAYGSYVNVAKNWSNGGYHTTERTLLRAQLDAIEDYVSKKESEQLSSVESEAYYQAKETVRKVGYDLTRLRLRPLEEGEACHVERRYTESNGFSFTGKEHVESIEDIAYIFKQLETSSVENSFLVLIKDGTPTVLHLSIGAYATTLAPIEQAIVAADAINPDKVLFVHNHPSGNISASKQDMDVQKKMKEIFGGKVMPAIIINTTSGKFGMFSEDGRLEDGNIPLPDEHNNIPINVYQFSQQVFAKDWNPEFAFRAVSPESIAEYVSSHRLGEHKKMSLIILDQAGHVTGNVFLPWTKLTDVDSHKNIMQIISYVNQMGGRSAILYGNYELGEDTRDTNKSIFKIKTAFSNSALHLMDVINIDDSALDRGAMEEDVEYGKRNLDEEKYREGYGSYTNSELSFINDPVAKMLGKSNRAEEAHKAFAERERQRMISRISELADKLHLNNIETVTDSNSLQGKKAKAKGFYSKSSGKITIVIPNHASVEDVEKTLLHEAVAHYGLRKLFGEHFETFLDNVYQNVEPEIRHIITSQAANNNWDFRTATEEYLAGLAERTDFERVHYAIWNKIKSLFLKMLHSIGFEGWSATELSDNELRYLLWRSYENMKEPGRYRSILGEAEDIAKQNELKVGNYDQQDTNSSNIAERGILYREDDSKEKERVNAREKYEQRVNRAMFQTQEALQDSMLGLKEAMNAITKAEGKNVNIEDIDGYENAYLGENRLSSVNKAEADAFAHLVFKPMLAEVSKLCKNAQKRAELVDYMMAKHGLERNAVMRNHAIEDIINNEKLSDAQKSARVGLAENRDYAGLTALTGKDNVTEAEEDAEAMVSGYESNHDTTNLWDKVNAVNAAILSKSYECGMMDKDTYEKISDMYKYYIPLRGFDETTSEEAYAYLLHQSSAFNAPIKVAKGRSSKADDPFANMQSMAESAITQGNRNKLVKQRFFNFVLNHPSDLVSISDMWLKYDDVADEWKPVFPDNFEENDSAEDVERKLNEFEERMKKLSEEDPDKYKHGKDTVNIPYRIVESRDLRQHQVVVKRGGRPYILTLNGNPRAAQALNGQTNPDNDTSGAIGAILKAGEMVNRQLSAFYTTRNPDFVVSNFIRDMLYSNTIVWVKESPNYALRFHRNIARCNPAQIKVLLAKHRKGTLDMNNKLEHMFYQFMMNGGETGYANVRDIEQHKNDIRRELKRANGKLSIAKAFNLLSERLDEYNRAVENCARFAAYLTSREMGRTVERSIYDAKEISVNFNKKGSGAKFMKAVGQTKIGNTSAFISGIGRSGFVFWNAAIQGTTNLGRQFKKHPIKAFVGAATMFLLGALVAGIGMGDGDDDEDANSYWNLPEYVRRSNILFKVGDQWVSIPLPVEYRAVYGMGELMVSAMSGKEHFTDSELGKAIAGQMTQVLPIDFLEGGGGVKAFVPSAIKPFAEVYSNKSWTGMPIYKDTPFNKNMPEWTKVYKSANKYLVNVAKVLNETTGGDNYTKGTIDINPAQIEYLLNGYFGGVSSTIDKLTKSAETIAGEREYDPRNFLLLNRVLKNGDERTEARAINNEYMRVKEEHDILKARIKHYENDTDKGIFDYADKIDFLYNSPEFARYEIFEDYSKDIDALYQELKEANDEEERIILEKELTNLKKEMINEMNKTRK